MLPASSVFTILFVCTGNLCRSPMAERYTRTTLDARLGPVAADVVVGSAGTWGREGAPMEPYAVQALDALGASGADFHARELAGDLVRASDLVLGAAREHRAAAVTLCPSAASHTFTMREFARLCAAIEPAALPPDPVAERGRALVRAAAAQRGLVPPERPDEDDLADPYGATYAAFQTCSEAVVAALQGPLDLLTSPA